MKRCPLMHLGQEFSHPHTGDVHRVTDVGERTFLTINTSRGEVVTFDGATGQRSTRVVTGAERQTWLAGPPYACAELVWDEYDQRVLEDVEGIEWVEVPTSKE
jgi:hypothetical protein